MNLIDLCVLVLLLLLGVRGYRRGLLRESIEAASALLGLVGAHYTFTAPSLWLSVRTGIPSTVTGPVFFVAIAIVLTSVGFGCATLVRRVVVTNDGVWRADSWGGLCFGALKGALIAALILVLLTQVPYTTVLRAVEESAAGRSVYAVMPEFFRHVDAVIHR